LLAGSALCDNVASIIEEPLGTFDAPVIPEDFGAETSTDGTASSVHPAHLEVQLPPGADGAITD